MRDYRTKSMPEFLVVRTFVGNSANLIDLLLCFGQPDTPPCDTGQDVNGDGTVNVLDLIEVLLAFGTSCP